MSIVASAVDELIANVITEGFLLLLKDVISKTIPITEIKIPTTFTSHKSFLGPVICKKVDIEMSGQIPVERKYMLWHRRINL
ncbi:hypothetical protein [Algoriphagus resistens]|uniref:hypothetical protein n=1 Tax=Algoriphagus resistens TaxID=1750590 RepID=UPI000A50610C|nr:hypothetical protein [Algoriphagus resistens]